jgi:hypothetical protein
MRKSRPRSSSHLSKSESLDLGELLLLAILIILVAAVVAHVAHRFIP